MFLEDPPTRESRWAFAANTHNALSKVFGKPYLKKPLMLVASVFVVVRPPTAPLQPVGRSGFRIATGATLEDHLVSETEFTTAARGQIETETNTVRTATERCESLQKFTRLFVRDHPASR